MGLFNKKKKQDTPRSTQRLIGSSELGNVYEELLDENDNKIVLEDGTLERGEYIGRLVADFSNDMFYLKPVTGPSVRLNRTQLSSLIANELIDFDFPESRDQLITYLMALSNQQDEIQKAEQEALSQATAMSIADENAQLFSRVRTRSRIARLTWTIGMLILIGVSVYHFIPKPMETLDMQNISGIGGDLKIPSENIQNSDYIAMLSEGGVTYGTFTQTGTKETWDTESGTSTVSENILTNTNVSNNPIHMRTLFYDKANYHQSKVKINNSDGGSNGIYLHNPSGYSLGVPTNELVWFSGRELSTVTIAAPEGYQDKTADETAEKIQERQESTAETVLNGKANNNSNSQEKDIAAQMPESWNGMDSASIDANRIAGSYWYTKNASGKQEDLRRKIAIYDISSLKGNSTTENSEETEAVPTALLNYQDNNSNFYDPIIGLDKTSNGSTYHLGYMQQDPNGGTGFFIRRIKTNEDILLQKYENTLSTQDITGKDGLISNYCFLGNKLFYEQSGSIWMIDISENKLKINIIGNNRTITRENPVEVCKVSKIRATIDTDNALHAKMLNESPVPVADYKPIAFTINNGGIEYGIVYVSNDNGNLVYQPIMQAVSSGQTTNQGTGSNTTSNGVSSGDDTAIENIIKKETQENNETQKGTIVTIPDVIGKTVTEAKTILENQGFNVQTTGGNGSVLGISPNGNVPYGSTITLTTGESNNNNTATTPSTTTTTNQNNTTPTTPTQNISESVLGLINNVGYKQNNSTIHQVAQTPFNIQQVAEDNTQNNIITICDTTTTGETITAFTVKGEQVVWIQKNPNTNECKAMISPIYYKDYKTNVTNEENTTETVSVLNGETMTEEQVNQTLQEQKEAEEKAKKEAEEKAKAEAAAKAQAEAEKQRQQQQQQQQQQQTSPTTSTTPTTVTAPTTTDSPVIFK